MKNINKFLLVGIAVTYMSQATFGQTMPNRARSRPSATPGITQGAPKPLPNSPAKEPVIYNHKFNKITGSARDGADIHVHSSSNDQAEVHISIDKTDRNNLIMSSNTYTSTYSAGYYYSNDGGSTWSGSDDLPGTVPTDGDPSTAYDQNGKAFLVNIDGSDAGFNIMNSTTKGTSWGTNVDITPSSANNFDKEMVTADNTPTSPNINNIYVAYADFATGGPVPHFVSSTNSGATFSSPLTLTTHLGSGCNVQTGPGGEVYVCWADYGAWPGSWPASHIGFAYSSNGGTSFSTSLPISFTGIDPGGYGISASFNNIGVNDFPSMAVDKSCGSDRGRIYVTYPENSSGTSVIRVKYSDDHGSTWSSASTVSISGATQSFFPWIAVDDATGEISVVYYAFDNPGSSFSTNVYVAYSSDGGSTWDNIKVSDNSFTTAVINASRYRPGYMGDYIGITAYGGKAFATWMDNHTGTWQAYVSEVDYPTAVSFSSTTDINVNGDVDLTDDQNSWSYLATNTITATANSHNFTIENPATVIMEAGSLIDLKPGFHAKSGCDLHAFIGTVTSCSNTLSSPFVLDPGSNANNPPGLAEDNNTDFSVYPNPSAGVFNVEIKVPDIPHSSPMKGDGVLYAYDVVDMMGRVIATSSDMTIPKNKFVLDLSNAKPGIYFLRLSSNRNFKGCERIIISG